MQSIDGCDLKAIQKKKCASISIRCSVRHRITHTHIHSTLSAGTCLPVQFRVTTTLPLTSPTNTIRSHRHAVIIIYPLATAPIHSANVSVSFPSDTTTNEAGSAQCAKRSRESYAKQMSGKMHTRAARTHHTHIHNTYTLGHIAHTYWISSVYSQQTQTQASWVCCMCLCVCVWRRSAETFARVRLVILRVYCRSDLSEHRTDVVCLRLHRVFAPPCVRALSSRPVRRIALPSRACFLLPDCGYKTTQRSQVHTTDVDVVLF